MPDAEHNETDDSQTKESHASKIRDKLNFKSDVDYKSRQGNENKGVRMMMRTAARTIARTLRLRTCKDLDSSRESTQQLLRNTADIIITNLKAICLYKINDKRSENTYKSIIPTTAKAKIAITVGCLKDPPIALPSVRPL